MVDWNNVVSAVATPEGLAVVERQPDGSLGAVRVIPSAPPPFTAVPTHRVSDRGPGTYAIAPPRQSAPAPGMPPVTPCPPGTHEANGQCYPDSGAPPGSAYPLCPPGTHPVDGKCVP